MDHKTLATQNEILRGVVGSTSLGTNLQDQDDRDEMGVCIEPPEYVCGLEKFEQYIYRTKPEGVRSGPGDLDLCIFSLRKFVHLASKGNPSILILLYLPHYEIIHQPLGHALVNIRDAFVSAEAGRRFLGYLTSQRMKLTGERSKKVSRPDLVRAHGYDTKFAMHALRLGRQGIEYLTEGKLTLPIPEPDRQILMGVRRGERTFKEVMQLIDGTETVLKQHVDKSTREIDRDTINDFLVYAHEHHWTKERQLP